MAGSNIFARKSLACSYRALGFLASVEIPRLRFVAPLGMTHKKIWCFHTAPALCLRGRDPSARLYCLARDDPMVGRLSSPSVSTSTHRFAVVAGLAPAEIRDLLRVAALFAQTPLCRTGRRGRRPLRSRVIFAALFARTRRGDSRIARDPRFITDGAHPHVIERQSVSP